MSMSGPEIADRLPVARLRTVAAWRTANVDPGEPRMSMSGPEIADRSPVTRLRTVAAWRTANVNERAGNRRSLARDAAAHSSSLENRECQ